MPFYVWLCGARRRGLQKVMLAIVASLFLLIYYLQKRGPLSDDANNADKPLPSFTLPAASVKPTEGKLRPSIPRILHQTWKSRDIPEIMRPWVTSWLRHNAEMEYWFWTDEDMRRLIATKFPSYLKLYDSYPDNAYRVDAFRYFVIYAYGGVYADMDMECLQSIEDVLMTSECLVSQEPIEHAHFLSTMGPPLVSNALMACRPQHPFFLRLISDLKSYAGFWGWADVLKATGPNMLTEVYRGYHKPGWFSTAADRVFLADPETFHPAPDESMVPRMQEMCQYSKGKDLLSSKFADRQEKLCAKLARYDFKFQPGKESYSLHHWTHTWAGERNDPWGVHGQSSRSFDVEELKDVER